jgi:hypothetical protein
VPSHQQVIDALWKLHYEKLELAKAVEAIGKPEHIQLALVHALNHYRKAWHSGRPYQREGYRKECEAGFKLVWELIEAWKKDPTPPSRPRTGRIRRSA